MLVVSNRLLSPGSTDRKAPSLQVGGGHVSVRWRDAVAQSLRRLPWEPCGLRGTFWSPVLGLLLVMMFGNVFFIFLLNVWWQLLLRMVAHNVGQVLVINRCRYFGAIACDSQVVRIVADVLGQFVVVTRIPHRMGGGKVGVTITSHIPTCVC